MNSLHFSIQPQRSSVSFAEFVLSVRHEQHDSDQGCQFLHDGINSLHYLRNPPHCLHSKVHATTHNWRVRKCLFAEVGGIPVSNQQNPAPLIAYPQLYRIKKPNGMRRPLGSAIILAKAYQITLRRNLPVEVQKLYPWQSLPWENLSGIDC